MAASQGFIDKIRTRVRDRCTSGSGTAVPNATLAETEGVTYLDEEYSIAEEQARDRLNADLGTSYASDTAVPSGRMFLLVLLASIEMAWLRAADSAGTGSGVTASITVPDLTVSEGSTTSGADYWAKQAQDWEEQYAKQLDDGGPDGDGLPDVIVGTITRHSHRTNSRASWLMDRGIAAPASVAAAAGDQSVTLTWARVYDDEFAFYEVYRATSSADLATPGLSKRIRVIPDPEGYYDDGVRRTRFTDTGLVNGTPYYYVIASVNTNDLRGYSSVVTATPSP